MSTSPGTSPAPTATPTPTTPPSSATPPSPIPPATATPPLPSSSPPPPTTTPTTPAPTAPVIPPPTTPVTPTISPPSPPTVTPVAPAISPPAPDTPGAASPPAPSTKTPPSPPSKTPPTPSTATPPSPPSPPSPAGSRGSPPPPFVPGRSPPRPSSSTPSPPSDSSSGISTGLVVGVAIGGVIVLVIATLLFICCRKKKRRDHHHGGDYYGPPPPALKEGGQHQQWHYSVPPPAPQSDHIVSIPPKISPPPALASRPPLSSSSIGSMPQPPPPPPFLNSSGGSNYSDYDSPLPPPAPGMSMGGFSKSTFTYEELVRATDGFSDANLLGQGGFGYVHKGVLPNGKEVAIKQLKIGSGQGEREFQAEVEIISRVHHKHLVSLVGYCSTGAQRMLVYEFVPNNTLEFHLHGKERPTMEWGARLKIALGSAKGLAYLHEDCHPKIIHRDIKSSNILLDIKFEAKVADFGLAKFSSDTNTHVSTRVMGTFGYLAPEYAASGKLTEKSDVFSFGVMLLELITGRRPVDSHHTFMDDSLVDWARPLLTRALDDGNYDTLADPRLQRSYNHNEMGRMVSCAAAAVRHSSRRRPQMSQIVRALEGDASLADLSEGVKPGHSTVYSSFESSDYDTHQYNEDMKKFRKMALSSQQYGSSEYSGPTSEYGLNPSGSSSEGQTTREIQMKKNPKDSQGFSGGS